MNNRLKSILLAIGVSLISVSTSYAASSEEYDLQNDGSYSLTEENFVDDPSLKTDDGDKEERESLFPKGSKPLWLSHFTWGAEFGSSIDLSGYDTSTFNIDAVLGYKNDYFKILGAGVGIHRSLGNGDNFIPIYAVMRTGFSIKPRLFFMSLKVGYSFNTMGDSPMFGDSNAQLGAGINLAMSKKFHSHIILAYEFRHFNKRHKYILNDKAENISLATLSFGVNF